jgi:hypothetical protein
MDKAKIEMLLDLIDEIVDDTNNSVGEKRDQIKKVASEIERWEMNLEEFVSWFEAATP